MKTSVSPIDGQLIYSWSTVTATSFGDLDQTTNIPLARLLRAFSLSYLVLVLQVGVCQMSASSMCMYTDSNVDVENGRRGIGGMETMPIYSS